MGPEVEQVPTLAEMSPRGCEVALAYYEAGRVEGIAEGRRQVHAELEAEWGALRDELMPRLRQWVPFDVLAERRGDRERAERQRRLLHERGVA